MAPVSSGLRAPALGLRASAFVGSLASLGISRAGSRFEHACETVIGDAGSQGVLRFAQNDTL